MHNQNIFSHQLGHINLTVSLFLQILSPSYPGKVLSRPVCTLSFIPWTDTDFTGHFILLSTPSPYTSTFSPLCVSFPPLCLPETTYPFFRKTLFPADVFQEGHALCRVVRALWKLVLTIIQLIVLLVGPAVNTFGCKREGWGKWSSDIGTFCCILKETPLEKQCLGMYEGNGSWVGQWRPITISKGKQIVVIEHLNKNGKSTLSDYK